MAKLYYGNGNCSIEGSNIFSVMIRYSGAIEIDDKTPSLYAIIASEKKNNIIITLFGSPDSNNFPNLNDLFDYVGEFKIGSVIVTDVNGENIPTTIHRVMDYTELLNSNAEDMTTNSENLAATYISGRRVAKTILKQPYVNNLHTSVRWGKLYLKNSMGMLKYEGYFHMHLNDFSFMTGAEHTEDSQNLYLSNGDPPNKKRIARKERDKGTELKGRRLMEKRRRLLEKSKRKGEQRGGEPQSSSGRRR